MSLKIVYATSNQNKIKALKEIISRNGIDSEILTLKDIHFEEEIVEDGKTFEENSLIKAKTVREFCDKNEFKNYIVIADDAGICVECLNGDPGVYSARYAGEHATQIEILNKLLTNMEKSVDNKNRNANFVCVLTGIFPNGKQIVARGECKGKISEKIGTLGGLTYSAVFIAEGTDKPMSDLNSDEIVISHREKATIKLIDEIMKLEKSV